MALLKQAWVHEIEHSRGDRIIRLLSNVHSVVSDDYALFLVGGTHAPVAERSGSLYREGARQIDVKSTRKPSKFHLNPLCWILPKSTSFAYSITPNGCMYSCYRLLEEYLLIDIIFVPHIVGDSVRFLLESGAYDRSSPDIYKNDFHLVYGFDTDHSEYETGIEEFVSIGQKCPNDLSCIFG